MNQRLDQESIKLLKQRIKLHFELEPSSEIDLDSIPEINLTKDSWKEIEPLIYFSENTIEPNEYENDRIQIEKKEECFEGMMKISDELSSTHKYKLISIGENKYKVIECNYNYFELIITGKNPMISIGIVPNKYVKNSYHVGWEYYTIGYHSDDGLVFYGKGKEWKTKETFNENDVVGVGIDRNRKLIFFTKNGKLIDVEKAKGRNYYFALGLETYEKVNINTGLLPFKFDLDDYRKLSMDKTNKMFYENVKVKLEHVFELDVNVLKFLSPCKLRRFIVNWCQHRDEQSNENIEIKERNINNYQLKKEVNYGYLYERLRWNQDYSFDRRDKEFTSRLKFDLQSISSHEYERERERMRDFDSVMCYKPVIYIYDNTQRKNNEIEMKLTLNEYMEIGMTYPQPLHIKEKEYKWNGKYSSNGNDKECCKVEIDNKKYDYIFWEGPCKNPSILEGEIIGMKKESLIEELEILLEKLGLNERERDDFIVYWLIKLTNPKGYKVTICNNDIYNNMAQLEVKGFNQIHRIMLKFEGIESIEELESLKTIDSIERRIRPSGKYIIEWGAIPL